MFESDGNISAANTAAIRRKGQLAMLSRNRRQLRGLRRRYVNKGRYAEACNLFAIAWMLYGMFNNDCKQLAALEDDYQELRGFAGSLDLGSVRNAITHRWCVDVTRGANQPARELEAEVKAIVRCLPEEGARNNLEETVVAFAILLQQQWSKKHIRSLSAPQW